MAFQANPTEAGLNRRPRAGLLRHRARLRIDREYGRATRLPITPLLAAEPMVELPAHSSTASILCVGDSRMSDMLRLRGCFTPPSILSRQVRSENSGSRK